MQLTRVLQPFLALAGPVSDGLVVQTFRECWASVPWTHATFHGRTPDALVEMRTHLLDGNLAVLDMLPGLDWGILSQHVTSRDSDAEEIALLGLHLCVLRGAPSLPEWWRQLIWAPVNTQPGTAHAQPRMVSLLAKADLGALRLHLTYQPRDVPFLLHPLATSPRLLERQPGARLLHAADLLVQAALHRSDPAFSTCVASVIKGLPLASLVRGHAEDTGHLSGAGQTSSSSSDCWQFSADERSQLISTCLIPLAQHHCSIPLATSPALNAHQAPAPAAAPSSKWRAPQLSQLVDRLHDDSASPHSPSRVSSPSRPSPAPETDLLGLGDSDSAAASGNGDQGATVEAAQRLLQEAVPLKALLGMLTQQPEEVMTSQPIPFMTTSLHRFEPGSMPLAEGLGLGGGALGGDAIDAGTLQTFRQHAAALMQDACLMEGLAFPLCLLRALFSSHNSVHTLSPAMSGLIEGVVSHLLHKHARHKGSGKGLGLQAIAASPRGQQQQLMMPASTPAHQETPPGDVPPANTSIVKLALSTLEGLAEDDVIQLARRSAEAVHPLTQALASEHLRLRLIKQTPSRWRICATETLNLVIATSSGGNTPTQTVMLWLSLLPWLEDSRWRAYKGHDRGSSQAREAKEPDMQPVEELLEALQERVLSLFGLQPPAASSAPSVGSSSFADVPQDMSVTDKLKGVFKSARKQEDQEAPETPPSPSNHPFSMLDLNSDSHEKQGKQRILPTWGGFKKMLVKGDDFSETNTRAGEPYFSGPVPGTESSQERMVIGGYGPEFVPTPPSQASSASTPFTSTSDTKVRSRSPSPPRKWGFKNLLGKKHEDAGSATTSTSAQDDSSSSGPIMQPSSNIGAERGRAKESSKLGSSIRRAWERRTGPSHQHGGAYNAEHDLQAQMAKQAELDMTVRLGLAAFATAAYIKTVLCPSLSNYIPRTGSSVSVGHLGSTPRQSGTGSVDRKGSEAGLLAGLHNPNRISLRGSKLDEHMMRELDGVLEQRDALDTLEELRTAPLVSTAGFDTELFFDAVPGLIQGQIPVHAFQVKLQAVLFPDSPLVAFIGC